jgi:hypothetical protein
MKMLKEEMWIRDSFPSSISFISDLIKTFFRRQKKFCLDNLTFHSVAKVPVCLFYILSIVCLSFSLSVSHSFNCLSVCLFLQSLNCLSVFQSACLCFTLIQLFVCLSFNCLSVFQSVCQFYIHSIVCVSFSLSVCFTSIQLFVYISVSLSVLHSFKCLSVFQSVCFTFI